ncbi:ribonuclease [Rhizobium wenxiniae]|uniref:ribonuclease T2 family protein n=1 Tax=Rhizobium wenxiniae TaxID=1737357 RepID=UPI001C6ED9FF|nr:ribonuclease [Rhizobium wenxiniae]MBW9087834.1 ribonuclease [Rhizobium wenxiniae]
MMKKSSALREVLFAAAIMLATAVFTLSPVNAQERRQDRQQDRAGNFDFYVLSLSWSPTFCATNKGGRNDQQCGLDKQYRFIVHGLWPQHEKGYPDFCRTSEPERVPRGLGETMFDIMPSMGLVGHQWRKHGSCSGLGQKAYFEKVRAAFERVEIPADLSSGNRPLTFSADEIEQKFLGANPGMSRKGIAASCEGRQLEEIRICLSKDLQFRDCAEVDRRGCTISQINLPPAR